MSLLSAPEPSTIDLRLPRIEGVALAFFYSCSLTQSGRRKTRGWRLYRLPGLHLASQKVREVYQGIPNPEKIVIGTIVVKQAMQVVKAMH